MRDKCLVIIKLVSLLTVRCQVKLVSKQDIHDISVALLINLTCSSCMVSLRHVTKDSIWVTIGNIFYS